MMDYAECDISDAKFGFVAVGSFTHSRSRCILTISLWFLLFSGFLLLFSLDIEFTFPILYLSNWCIQFFLYSILVSVSFHNLQYIFPIGLFCFTEPSFTKRVVFFQGYQNSCVQDTVVISQLSELTSALSTYLSCYQNTIIT